MGDACILPSINPITNLLMNDSFCEINETFNELPRIVRR